VPEQTSSVALTLPAALHDVRGQERTGRIAEAVESWRNALAGSGLPDTLLVSGPGATASWLDLTHAHPNGLAQLFAGRPTRLSSLFREADAHATAWRQARSIRAAAQSVSAQRGVQGCCLAIGVATWRPAPAPALSSPGPAEVLAPVVLRACTIRPRTDGDDFELDLDDAVLINPELVRALVDGYGIEADGAHLAALTRTEKGFDPRPVYAWLEERCRSPRAFSIQRTLVLATFAAGSGAVLADLEAAVPAIASHRLLGRVAEAYNTIELRDDVSSPPGAASPVLVPGPGDGEADSPGAPDVRAGSSATPAAESGESRRLAVVGRLGPRVPRPVRPAVEADPGEELLVVDCDPGQRGALAAALRGEDVVIDGPPGSGVTHALVAVIGALAHAGRRVLVLSPRLGSGENLLGRLGAAGLGDLVLDLREDAGARTPDDGRHLLAGLDAAVAAPPSLPEVARMRTDDEGVATVRRVRDVLDGEVTALHEVRSPWNVSCYDAMVALAELTGRAGAPTGSTRLPDAVLTGLDAVSRERLRVHLQAAASAGAFTLTRVDTRWYDAAVSTAPQARAALEAALVLRAGLERARTAMTEVTAAAGLRPAADVAGWLPLLDVLTGVRAVLDVMQPQIYEQPLVELAGAVAPRPLRAKEPITRAERRRRRRLAHSLTRPGAHVDDLYQVLLTAAEQKLRWRGLSPVAEGPRVVPGITEADTAVRRVVSAIDVLDGVFAGAPGPALRDLPFDELQQRVFDLAGDTQGILGQPRRATLVDGLRKAGLGDLVDDLRSRRVGPASVDAELDLAWWSSVRDHIVRSDPRLARHDADAVRSAGRELRTAEAARVARGASLVQAAVTARAASVTTARDEQVQVLRQELGRPGNRPRLVDLVRRCGDVLSAVTPVWMMSPGTVAGCLIPPDPSLPPIVDAVVVDDAGHIGVPEVVAALARGAQLIVAGDSGRLSPPEGARPLITSVSPFATVCRLDRDHRARDGRMLVPLAPRYHGGWLLTPGPDAAAPLSLEPVPEGVAIPVPGEELPVSPDAEVARVLELVERHALRRPDESLVVVTLSERHAERIEEAVRSGLASRPVLESWLTASATSAEPFAVRSVQRALGLERDAAIVSIGLARTPHGRVLHRFGVLDSARGSAVLTTALTRARSRNTVVCCFTADDLDVDRLRTPGARLLRDVLLFAGGRGSSAGRRTGTPDGLVADLRDRLAAAGLPVRSRLDDGSWPLDIAVADPRVPGRMLVAVDVDGPSFAARSCRERELARPARFERAGWVYTKVSSLDLFADPALEVARVRAAWDEAMARPLPPDAYPAPVSGPEDDPVIPERSDDDRDEGWGDTPAGGSRDSRDAELERDRPPHWE
jgi:restriction endonuclease-like protein